MHKRGRGGEGDRAGRVMRMSCKPYIAGLLGLTYTGETPVPHRFPVSPHLRVAPSPPRFQNRYTMNHG